MCYICTCTHIFIYNYTHTQQEIIFGGNFVCVCVCVCVCVFHAFRVQNCLYRVNEFYWVFSVCFLKHQSRGFFWSLPSFLRISKLAISASCSYYKFGPHTCFWHKLEFLIFLSWNDLSFGLWSGKSATFLCTCLGSVFRDSLPMPYPEETQGW